MYYFKLLLFGILLLFAGSTASFASNIAIKNDVYYELEYLSALGLIDSAFLGTRPLDRAEIARLIVEASKNADQQTLLGAISKSSQKRVKYVLQRLNEEFKDEIADLKKTVFYIKPLERANLTYTYLSGSPSTFYSIKALQEPFNYNNEGISLISDESNLLINFEADARFKLLSFHISPLLTYKNSDNLNAYLQHAYGKVYIRRFSIEVGKDSLWWGQGRHGSLILTNNAEPFTMIKLNNEIPFNLPLLGLFRFDFFITKLEEERDYPRPYFSGLRFSFKPTPSFELGLYRTVMTGGKGLPSLDLGDISTILIGKNLEARTKGESNQIAGGDLRLRITPLKAYLYVEAAGEDEAGMFPSKWAYLTGLYLSDIFGADLRIEYADTAFEYGGWYTHGTYTSGYTYKSRIIGHPMGGDAKDLFIGTSFFLMENTRVSLHYDYKKRGVSKNNPEIHHEFVLTLKKKLINRIALTLKTGYEKINDFENVKGRDRENNLVEFSFESKW